jgi:hypothetical protein
MTQEKSVKEDTSVDHPKTINHKGHEGERS